MKVFLLSLPLSNSHPRFNTGKLTLFLEKVMADNSPKWKAISDETFSHDCLDVIPCSLRQQPKGENNQSTQTPISSHLPFLRGWSL